MEDTRPPRDVLHGSRILPIILAFGVLGWIWMGVTAGGPLGIICFLFAVIFLVYLLGFTVRSIVFYDNYFSINYILRKRLVVNADVDFVSIEHVYRKGVRYEYVVARLRSGKKINIGGTSESVSEVYEKVKACESTNEEFLRGR